MPIRVSVAAALWIGVLALCACHSDSKPTPDAGRSGMDASGPTGPSIDQDIGDLEVTASPERLEGALPVQHAKVIFGSEIDMAAERVHAWIESASKRVEVELSSLTEGQITIGETSLDGHGELSSRERAALESLDDPDFVVALGMIPLELGCQLDGGNPADPRLAALLFPLQLLLKYSDDPPSVEALAERASCRYFLDNPSQTTNHDALRLSNDEPFPAVFGFQLLDEQGATQGCPSCKAPSRPCGALCPHACGADCDQDACEQDECAAPGGVATRYVCGTHEGCAEHDDCYDNCNRRYGCETSVANFVCHRVCDLQCINNYGLAGPLTWPLLLEGTVLGTALAATSVLYPCGLWAMGLGPFSGTVEAVYAHSAGSGSGVDSCGPFCGDGECGDGESAFNCPEDCLVDGGSADDAQISDAGDAGTVADGGTTAAGPVTGSDTTGAPAVTYRGLGVGDPHFTTFDGVAYDMQGVGELVLVASNDGAFEVQVRTKPYGRSDRVAVIAAIAIKMAGERFMLEADGTARQNGAALTWPAGATRRASGVAVYRSGLSFIFVAPDGTQIRIAGGSYMNVGIHLAAALRGSVSGLLGNSDGARLGDVASRNGQALPDSPTFSYFYQTFVESWRVSQASSLFDYASGESTETFTDRMFPAAPATPAGLSSAARDAAAAACARERVPEEWLEACVVDVGYTGDEGFIAALRGLAAPGSRLTVRPDVVQGSGGGMLNPSGSTSDGALLGMLGTDSQNFTVTATAGQTLWVRLVDRDRSAFTPTLRVRDAGGAVVAQASSADVAAITYAVPGAATYAVEVADGAAISGTSRSYTLYFALTPGSSEGGALPSGGGDRLDTIELGDIDTYTFDGQAGQALHVRVANAAGAAFTPAFWVYAPDGALVLSDSGASVAGGTAALPSAGRYTLVISDYSVSYRGSGDYRLSLALAAGANEGGLLPAGGSELRGSIELGDIDSYTFDGQAGQAIQVRVADVSGTSFTPAFWVYAPNGALVLSNEGASVAGGTASLPSAGRYTLVIGDYSVGYASAGEYAAALALAPGANEGGLLPAGGSELRGTIELGDIDSYTFDAQAGHSIQVRVADLANAAFTPAFWVYAPNGALVLSNSGASVAGGAITLSTSGRYTVLVSDYSVGYASAGDYALSLARAPGAQEVGALIDGSGSLTLGDIDSYTLAVPSGVQLTVTAAEPAAAALTPAITLYNQNGGVATSCSGANSATCTYRTLAAETLTVMVYDYSTGYAGFGDYQLTHSVAP